MIEKELKENMKDFYSSSKLYMNKLKTHGIEVYAKYLQKILEFVPAKARVLDIGCGVGQVSNFLQKKGYKVTGIDFSPLFIKESKKAGKADFKIMDSTNLKFPDCSFDAVISAETLEHIPNPKKALEEMSRVLRQSGLMILRFPNKLSVLDSLAVFLSKKPKFKITNPNLGKNVGGDDEDLCYIASTADIGVFLKNNGFKILYSKPLFWPSALIVARKY